MEGVERALLLSPIITNHYYQSGRQYHHHILAHTIEDRMNYKSAHSPLARSPRSKSITDNADATDLFFHGFLLCVVGFSAPAGRNYCHGLSRAGGYPAPYRRKYNPR